MLPKLCLPALLASVLAAQAVDYSYDPAGRLTGVRYPDGKTITYNYDPAGNLLRRTVARAVEGPAPVTSAGAVVNAASFQPGPVAPGEVITIYGTDIGPKDLAGVALTSAGFVDSLTGDTMVLFDGVPAPLIYASAGQTSVIVPYGVKGPSTQMVVAYQGRQSDAVTLPVAAAAPGLFAANSAGSGPGAILNEDATLNSKENPAAKGSIVVLYGTGEGATNPAGVDGRVATSVYPKPVAPVKVTINGVEAEILYAGAAPSLVAGVLQLNVRIPTTVPSGDVPVVLMVGDASSQANLTVAVQ